MLKRKKPQHDSKQKAPSLTFRSVYYFWSVAKKYRAFLLGGLITTPLVILFRTIIPPLVFARMIELASVDPVPDNLFATLLPYALAYIGIELLRNFVLGPLRLYCVWKMEICAMYDLGNQIFETISAQSMQFHSNRFSGSLVSQANKMLGAFENFMDLFFWEIFPVIIDLVSILIIMTPRVPAFSLAMLAFVAFFMLISKIWFNKLKPINEREAELSSKQTGQLSDSISNIVSVKSYAKEAYEKRRFASFNKAWFTASSDALFANTKRNYCLDSLQLILVASSLLIFVYGRSFLGLSVATLILITNYTSNIAGDLWSVHSVFKSLNRIFGNAKEMTEILDLEDDVMDAENAKPLKITSGEIIFRDISFAHQGTKTPLFDHLSLQIKPGERVGLVGLSGSGKTTLTKLLLRFADVDSGTIEIDNMDIKTVTQKSLREGIAYVPQESSLFHRSIFDNIAYARPGASKAEVERAARLANASDFIKSLPDGYNTMVGERGVKLSGGQRQRIAIARAILKDAPILVLDEATSALDSESEALIQEALEKLMKGRTSLVVAHRLSTVASLDRIIVLKDGEIVEQGTHAELLKQSGAYAHLWARQSGAFLD